ncbi:Septin-domain-containing protein [Backusella circina FSU 941]|nr:Septin-domain-containing protein [Backusella circina FSU 941]
MLLRRSKSRRNTIHHLNLMVVGSEGTGKTSFIRTFYETLTKEDIISFQESTPMLLKNPVQPTQEITSISMQMRDGTALTLIDTPGFTTGFEHQVFSIAKYIDLQFEKTLIEESKVKRDTKAVDTHIHSCLYFINHRIDGLGDTDRCILRMLSSRVNVIPIIGKADLLTIAQVQQMKDTFRKEVFDIFHIPIYGYIPDEPPSATSFSSMLGMLQRCINEDEDHEEEAKIMTDYLASIPFTVISYEEDRITGRPIAACGPILGRCYPWAVIQCHNTHHCDFDALKATVLAVHRDLLRMGTFDRFYEQFRTERLLKRKIGKMTRIESKEGVALI